MTATEYAKTLGAVTRKQGDKQTATIASVGDIARFASVLRKAGIEYAERFANNGRAIKFVFTDGELPVTP